MYNKLFTKILDSSIWLESNTTRIVWLTLLASMDEDGFTSFASVSNLAHRARVTLEECNAAVTVLESEDPNSSDPENNGKRIERVPGGWMVLNAVKYKQLVSREVAKQKTRERVRRFREKNNVKRTCNGHVTPSETESETDTYKEEDSSKRYNDLPEGAKLISESEERIYYELVVNGVTKTFFRPKSNSGLGA